MKQWIKMMKEIRNIGNKYGYKIVKIECIKQNFLPNDLQKAFPNLENLMLDIGTQVVLKAKKQEG